MGTLSGCLQDQPRGTLQGPGRGGAGLACGTVAKGTGGGASSEGEGAGPLWGSLVLEPGEAGWRGPPSGRPPLLTARPPPPRASGPQHPPLLSDRSRRQA